MQGSEKLTAKPARPSQTWERVHSNDLDEHIATLIASGARITQIVMLANGYTFGVLSEKGSPS